MIGEKPRSGLTVVVVARLEDSLPRALARG